MMTSYANGYGRRDEPEECYDPGKELACPDEWLHGNNHDNCGVCNGHGYVFWKVGPGPAICPCCGGRYEHFWGAGMDADRAICSTCNGYGSVMVFAPN